jgi:polyhydroxybutyrate depolymerase
MIRLLTAAALAVCIASGAWSCGPDTDCMIGERHYRIAMPEGHDGVTPVGAIVFAHGYRGSARGAMRNMGMRRMVSDMGLALIAVKSLDADWVIPNAPRHMDSDGAEEFAYFEDVMSDAAARFALDTDRVMMTGFSAGGMMVWNLACARPDLFAGFAPIAGTFWLRAPARCADPVVSIVHIHGTEDRTVPLAGRAIGSTRQGDVREALEMYRAHGGFGRAEMVEVGDLACARRENDVGAVLEFCTFPGGHSFRRGFLEYAWERLVAAGRL